MELVPRRRDHYASELFDSVFTIGSRRSGGMVIVCHTRAAGPHLLLLLHQHINTPARQLSQHARQRPLLQSAGWIQIFL